MLDQERIRLHIIGGNPDMTEINKPVSRRTVAKGIAWTAPVLAVAGTAPAFAVTKCEPKPVIDPNLSCKKANVNSYYLAFAIAGSNCDLENCSGTITQIKEKTGQARILFAGDHEIGNDGITLCDTNNMASSVLVTGSITCGTTTVNFTDLEVNTPQFTSTGVCSAATFCS